VATASGAGSGHCPRAKQPRSYSTTTGRPSRTAWTA